MMIRLNYFQINILLLIFIILCLESEKIIQKYMTNIEDEGIGIVDINEGKAMCDRS